VSVASTYAEYYGAGPIVQGTAIAVDGNGSIYAQVGSTPTVSITCNQTVTSLSLAFTVETKAKTDVATVSTGSINKSGTTASLVLTSAMTASERTLRWSLTNTANGEQVAGGEMFVTYDAQGDS
jgi:hypothetical protein